MTDEEIRVETKAFVDKLHDTDTYRKYCYERDRIKQHPDLYAEVNEYRRKTFELQNNTDQDKLFDALDAYEKEYEKFRENPIVEGFLKAELAYCRLMQELNDIIMDHLDFE